MKIEIVGKTDKGKVRNVNQDNFRIERLGKQTYACVVCDGMGGIRGGSEASCIAAVSFMVCLKRLCAQEPQETTKNLLTRSLNEANTAVYSFASLHPELDGMGTTLVAFLLKDGNLTWINVGDSRLYAANDESLVQISNDHSLVEEMIKNGMLTPEEAENAPMKNVITRAVGVAEIVEADVNEIANVFEQYSYVLLCSDGLTNMTGHDAIHEILTAKSSTGKKIDKLFASANASGGYDNITAVLLSVSEK